MESAANAWGFTMKQTQIGVAGERHRYQLGPSDGVPHVLYA